MSYTQVSYKNVVVNESDSDLESEVLVNIKVQNCGTYEVQEPVQLYITSRERGYPRYPKYQLRRIQTITLQPGESRTIKFVLAERDFSYITEEGKCMSEPGEYEIFLGGQQPDAVSQELTGQSCQRIVICKTGNGREVDY